MATPKVRQLPLYIDVMCVAIIAIFVIDIMETVATHAIDLIDNIKDMDVPSQHEKLKRLDLVLTETLKRSEEKVALAKSTFDAVRQSYPSICMADGPLFFGARWIGIVIGWMPILWNWKKNTP